MTKHRCFDKSLWWQKHNNVELKSKLRFTRKLRNKYSKLQKGCSVTGFGANSKNFLLNEIKNQRALNQRLIRKQKAIGRQKQIQGQQNHAWNIVRRLNPKTAQTKTSSSMLKIIDPLTKKITIDQQYIANLFLNFYRMQYNQPKNFDKVNVVPFNSTRGTFTQQDLEVLDAPFTISELDVALNMCNMKSSPSPHDHISFKMLSLMSTNAKQTFIDIINKIYIDHTAEIPKVWKISSIKPIRKPGKSPLFCKNYRPIALTSNPGKLVERMVVNHVTDIVDNIHAGTGKKPLLSRDQYGFRKFVGSEDMLLRLNNEISIAKQEQLDIYTLSFDITSAYNNLAHPTIQQTLTNYLKSTKESNFYKYITTSVASS